MLFLEVKRQRVGFTCIRDIKASSKLSKACHVESMEWNVIEELLHLRSDTFFLQPKSIIRLKRHSSCLRECEHNIDRCKHQQLRFVDTHEMATARPYSNGMQRFTQSMLGITLVNEAARSQTAD